MPEIGPVKLPFVTIIGVGSWGAYPVPVRQVNKTILVKGISSGQ
ncbi:MAG: hypothetical protein JWL65_2214 [Gammaproteobacteria bacterium]|nr:hypothetical protein [Gammaproteobacteria bacterium]